MGDTSEEAKQLIKVTRELFKGIEYARAGNRISDISKAIQAHAESYGYGVVRS